MKQGKTSAQSVFLCRVGFLQFPIVTTYSSQSQRTLFLLWMGNYITYFSLCCIITINILI